MNGESSSVVWPTLGSRTAKEQNIYQCVAELVVYHVVRYYVTREWVCKLWDSLMSPPHASVHATDQSQR